MPKIKRVDPSEVYQDTRNLSRQAGEHNDCTVVALSILSGETYEQSKLLLAAKGRKDRKAGKYGSVENCLRDLGFKLNRVQLSDMIKKMPKPHCDVLKNLTTHHPRRFPGLFDSDKNYVVNVRGRILAIVGGQVQDWSVNNSRRIIEMYEVYK